jgi:hypothetical protein
MSIAGMIALLWLCCDHGAETLIRAVKAPPCCTCEPLAAPMAAEED